MRCELGDFVVQLGDQWVKYVGAPVHASSVAFHEEAGPHELVLTCERVLRDGRTREQVVDTYVRGKVLATRRGSLSAMGAGELDDEDVVGPVRPEAKSGMVGARQWAHLGDGSIVVAVLAAEVVADAFSCLAISVLCNVPVDLELAVERLASEVIAGVALR